MEGKLLTEFTARLIDLYAVLGRRVAVPPLDKVYTTTEYFQVTKLCYSTIDTLPCFDEN